jgi:hypothetical protein
MKALLPIFVVAILSSFGFAASPQKVTVPLTVEDNRLFVDVQFLGKDGSSRTAHLWLDTGTPDFQITEKLARDLGLDLSRPPIKSEDGIEQAPVELPGIRVGDISLDLKSARPMVVLGSQPVFAGSHTDGNLPATVLMHYQVLLDVPHRSFTLAAPGVLKRKGKRVAAAVQPQTGMVQLDATVDGAPYSLALDSGAPYSMISSEAIKRWSSRHKDWPTTVGVAGAANLLPGPLRRGPMMRVPLMATAGISLKNVGFAGMDPEFVSWYSKKTAAPESGFLSWNFLRAYRVTIDYPGSALYFEKEGEIDAHDADSVGLTLAQSRTGGYGILSIVQKDGRPTVDGAQPGDKLLKVDGLDITRLDLESALHALQGRPGEVRTLTLDRKGQTLTIKATVMHLI